MSKKTSKNNSVLVWVLLLVVVGVGFLIFSTGQNFGGLTSQTLTGSTSTLSTMNLTGSTSVFTGSTSTFTGTQSTLTGSTSVIGITGTNNTTVNITTGITGTNNTQTGIEITESSSECRPLPKCGKPKKGLFGKPKSNLCNPGEASSVAKLGGKWVWKCFCDFSPDSPSVECSSSRARFFFEPWGEVFPENEVEGPGSGSFGPRGGITITF